MNIKHKSLRSIGGVCRRIRQNAGLKVKDIARMTGYSTGLITQFESGKNNNLKLYLFYMGVKEHYEKNPENAADPGNVCD